MPSWLIWAVGSGCCRLRSVRRGVDGGCSGSTGMQPRLQSGKQAAAPLKQVELVQNDIHQSGVPAADVATLTGRAALPPTSGAGRAARPGGTRAASGRTALYSRDRSSTAGWGQADALCRAGDGAAY